MRRVHCALLMSLLCLGLKLTEQTENPGRYRGLRVSKMKSRSMDKQGAEGQSVENPAREMHSETHL